MRALPKGGSGELEELGRGGRVAASFTPRQRDVPAQRRRDQAGYADRGTGALGVGARKNRHAQAAGDQAPDSLTLIGFEGDAGFEARLVAG